MIAIAMPPKPKPTKPKRKPLLPGLRFDVLSRANYRCQACGASSKDSGVRLEIDHIIPVARGGATTLKNLQALCRTCNRGKSAKMRVVKVVAKKPKKK